ncbi:MAG TPA: shikimate dehydrogenase [Candidatus Binataceae bacterium]
MRQGPISATTRLTGIFGDPIEHSLSPAMHNAAYAALGMDRRYLAFHVTRAELLPALRGIVPLKIAGVNLTLPHKARALAVMDELTAEGDLLGAINCVIHRDGKLVGDNTDARGLERDLRAQAILVAARTALVIGAGGAGAAAVVALSRLKAARVIIANRTARRASALARRFAQSALRRTRFEAVGLRELVNSSLLAEVACVVNATSLGLTGGGFPHLKYDATPPNCFFYDTLYARRPSKFLTGAIGAGRKCADGAGMLVEQGELAFHLFNGVRAPHGVMRRALMDALGRTR